MIADCFTGTCSLQVGDQSNRSSIKNLTQNFIRFNFLECSQHANHLVELHFVGNLRLVVFVEPGEVNYWWYLQTGIYNGKQNTDKVDPDILKNYLTPCIMILQSLQQ